MTSIEGMALNLVSLMNDSFQNKEERFVSATVSSCFNDTAVIEIVTTNSNTHGEKSDTFVVMMSKSI